MKLSDFNFERPEKLIAQYPQERRGDSRLLLPGKAARDPLDTELMDAMITAELLLNKSIYSDSYLKAYRQSK